jgi:hypothetical protein
VHGVSGPEVQQNACCVFVCVCKRDCVCALVCVHVLFST